MEGTYVRLCRPLATAFAAAVTALTLTAPAHAGSAPGAAAPQSAAATTLTTLTCYENSDATGGDDPYLQINGTTVWTSQDSADCDPSSPVTVPVNRLARTGDAISLYDENFPDADEHLGSATIEGNRGTLVFNLNGAHYTLSYGPA
ncbi:hypothetical protein ACWGF3_14870 [Streptomyces xanthophaeus]